MQPNRQVLIWAGLSLLLLAGLVVFALVRNQPEMETGIAIYTSETEQQPPEEGESTPEPEGTPDSPADSTSSDATAIESPAAPTPTSMSRTSLSIPQGTAEQTLTPSGQESQTTNETETNATEAGTE